MTAFSFVAAALSVTPVHALHSQPASDYYEHRIRPGVRAEHRGSSPASEYFASLYRHEGHSHTPEPGACQTLNRFLLLTPNWDGQGGIPPDPVAVELAEAVLLHSEALGLRPQIVAPDVDGGMAIYFANGVENQAGGFEREAGIIIDNDCGIAGFVHDRLSDHLDVFDLDVNTLVSTLERIRQFVQG